jgi:2,4-dienoyl-CoA reductase-like NADH-dependent reductase (Old Yellow Enzyme family)/thioredoxin reductase
MDRLLKLFEPIKIGNMEMKNRIVMGPLGHGMTYATKPEGYVTDQFIAFYEARARGGVGFIQLTVAGLGRPFATGLVFSPGILSMIDDDHIDSARRFTDAMHKHGTKVSFQLTHHGAAIARAVQHRPPVEFPELMRVVTSTGKKDPVTGFETFSMSKDEIKGLVVAFAQAAKRGKAAGFDAVRIQGCHAYLIQQFLSPRINKRTDEYGGSVENRARLACEIIRGVRQAVGSDFPILIRMNGDDHVEGGITLDQGIQHAKLFVEAGVNALDISSGPSEAHHWQFISMYQPSGALVPLAAAIKKAVNVPVMAVGKIDAVLGERILQEGKADLIQLARALMADPDLANKAREGRLEDIRPCIYCGWCQTSGTQGAYASCTVNMGMGKELEYKLDPAVQRKKVMVIGGGPAGMEAARTLAQRGHETSLFEKSGSLGGQWNILSHLLPEEAKLVNYLSTGMKKAGVNVHLNKEVTAKMVLEVKPDAVVVATGSTSATLDIPGINGKNVVQAVDVLTGKVETGKEVVVLGGRIVGLDTALFLAERGKRVSVVTRSSIGRGIVHNLRATLFEYLVKYGAYLYDHTVPDSITEKGVNCWRTSGDSGDRESLFFFLPADTIVLAVGAVNDSRLGDELTGLGPEVYKVGDCAGKRSIFAAIRGGSEAGRKI